MVRLLLSDVQWRTVESVMTRPTTVAVGAIRSGKTFAACLGLLVWLQTRAEPRTHILLAGRRGESVEAVLFEEILRLAELDGTLDQWERRSAPRMLVYRPKGIRLLVAGAYDERSETRIRGVTAQAVLADEAALYPQTFLQHLLSRVSTGERKRVLTLNPDHPRAWVKTELIDRICRGEVDGEVIDYRLEDNPSLSPEYRAEVQRLYSGVFAERYLEGRWVAAEGVVYRGLDRGRHVLESPPATVEEWVIAIDWGYEHPLACLLVGILPDGRYWIDDEIYERGILVGPALTTRLRDRGWLGLPIATVYADSARPDLCEALRRELGVEVVAPAKPRKGEMIMLVQRAIEGDRLLFSRRCVRALAEHEAYHYRPGTEEPEKRDDHTVDAVQYLLLAREGVAETGRIYGLEEVPLWA